MLAAFFSHPLFQLTRMTEIYSAQKKDVILFLQLHELCTNLNKYLAGCCSKKRITKQYKLSTAPVMCKPYRV